MNVFIFSRTRDYNRDSVGLRDGSEMIVADVCVKGKVDFFFLGNCPDETALCKQFFTYTSFDDLFILCFLGEKKRHHHHHHKPTNGHNGHNRNNEPRDSHLVASNARRDHRNEHF